MPRSDQESPFSNRLLDTMMFVTAAATIALGVFAAVAFTGRSDPASSVQFYLPIGAAVFAVATLILTGFHFLFRYGATLFKGELSRKIAMSNRAASGSRPRISYWVTQLIFIAVIANALANM